MQIPINSPPARSLSRRSRLAKYLAVAYTLLVAYASLYPFAPWRPLGANPFVFLFDPWPRFYSAADVALNVVGYMPLGLLVSLSALAHTTSRKAVVLATLLGAFISLCMESTQTYLPLRVPSNLDLLSNGLGALAGAFLGITAGKRWLLSGQLYRLRNRIFLPGSWVDLGFVIIVLWLFTQLFPSVWLFGSGDLRYLVRAVHNFSYSPESYRLIEAGVTAFNLAGIGLFMTSLARPDRSVAAPLMMLTTAALLVKTAAAVTIFKTGDASLWLTQGAMLGIPVGIVIYALLSVLPRAMLTMGAAVALVAGAFLVNMAPLNPYIVASIQIWQSGHFLSFNGTTRFVSSAWPYIAAAYSVWWAWRQGTTLSATMGTHRGAL